MVKKLKGEVESTQYPRRVEGGGLLTEKISRRDFGKLLGAQAVVLFSTLPLAACGGSVLTCVQKRQQ